MSYIGDGIARQMAGAMFVCFLLGAALVAVCGWVVPWLWAAFLRPWLHALTAA